MNEPPFCKSKIVVICEFTVLFNPAIKLELELILVKLLVIVEFKLFIKCVLDEILLIFVIKLELEEILLKLVVVVEFKLFIKNVFELKKMIIH